MGASLAMESVPAKWRGILSGVLQEGYALGNLLAAVAFWTIFPHWGWRPMFFIGGLPALLTLFIRAKVKESDAWKATAAARTTWGDYFRAVAANGKRFLYLVLLMAALSFMSHGTQDLYPTFLQRQLHFDPRTTAIVSVVSMLGAIAGGIVVGLYSDRRGRRRAMVTSSTGDSAGPAVGFWAACRCIDRRGRLPDAVHGAGRVGRDSRARQRALSGPAAWIFPGFAYQLGVLIAASAPYIEAVMSRRMGYGQAMGAFAAIAFASARS